MFASYAVALMLLFAGLWTIVPFQLEKSLERTLSDRGGAIARQIANHLPLGRAPLRTDPLTAVIDEAVAEQAEVRHAWVLSCRGDGCTSSEVVASRGSGDRASVETALSVFANGLTPLPAKLPDGEILVGARAVARGEGVWVLLVMNRSGIEEATAGLQSMLLVALALGLIIFLVLVWFWSRLVLVGPLRSIMGVASSLSQADLTAKADRAGTREFDAIAEALNVVTQNLHDTLARVRGVTESIGQVSEQLGRAAGVSSTGAATVLSRVDATSTSIAQLQESLGRVATHVESLYTSAEESSSSIMEMSATNDEVAENVEVMSRSVEETTRAIEQMTASILDVAQHVGNLLQSAEHTSASMRDMDVSIGQVEMNATETSRLSEQVSADAASGVERLGRTLEGIQHIKRASNSAMTVIDQLNKRVEHIGNIVDVIDDVAEQTNLLALNAAIIAAQAGPQGKGFGVVAEEIKALAERTGDATREIAELIRAVQDESRNAGVAMSLGVRAVDEGVALGLEAEHALKQIDSSARRSTHMVRAIANATVEQARGSKQVTASLERIVDAVQLINQSASEQTRGTERMMESADRMKLLTQHVRQSVSEQAHGSSQIGRSIEHINDLVTSLNRAQSEQVQVSQHVLLQVGAIRDVAEAQERGARNFELAIETLRQQADVLRGEIRKFRV